MASQKTVRVVAAAIFDNQGKVLICKRPVGSSLAGYWEFPGGKVEPGEPDAEALVREIKEELRVEIQPEGCSFGAALGPAASGENVAIELIGFKAKISRGEIVLVEHEDSKWLRPDDIIFEELGRLDQILLSKLF